MIPASPPHTPAPATAASRPRLGRLASLAAGATLGLGALAAPLAGAGSAGAEATDPVTLVADASAPSVTPGSTSVKAGGEVAFTVSGFPAGGQLAVKLDDDAVLLKDLAIGDDGRVSGTVTVPTGTAPGDGRWLRFLAPQTSVRSENLTVTGDAPPPGPSPTTDPAPSPKPTESAPAAVPKVRLTDSGVTAGDKVTFTLSGFVRGQSVTAKLDDEEIIGQWPSTGADGSFTGTVTVPSDATKGAHRLRFLAPNPSTSLRADFTVTTGSASGSDGTTGSSGGNAAGSSGTPVPAASGAPASASTSRGATAEVTASQVEAGGQIHFKVTKFPAGQTVTVKFDDEEILGQWKADTAGAYEGT